MIILNYHDNNRCYYYYYLYIYIYIIICNVKKITKCSAYGYRTRSTFYILQCQQHSTICDVKKLRSVLHTGIELEVRSIYYSANSIALYAPHLYVYCIQLPSGPSRTLKRVHEYNYACHIIILYIRCIRICKNHNNNT